MKNLIIIGAGGFARGIYWMVQKSLGYGVDWQIKGFLDGNVKLSAKEYELLPENFWATSTLTKFATTTFLLAESAILKLEKFLSKKFCRAAGSSST